MAAAIAPSGRADPDGPGAALRVRRVEGSVPAGFPSPADDFAIAEVDLLRELVVHPQATFLVRAAGASMSRAGIHDGDMLVVAV